MNYFELFEIPVSFHVDATLLANKYQELSRLHQDKNPKDGERRADMVNPSDIDKGYKILTDPDKTIKHILQLKGLWGDEDKYELDPQFLMEVMDINEELVELGLDEKQELLINTEQKTSRLLLLIYDEVAAVIETYKDGVTSEEELLQVKDFYYKKKYLQGILDRIRGIRNIASPL